MKMRRRRRRRGRQGLEKGAKMKRWLMH